MRDDGLVRRMTPVHVATCAAMLFVMSGCAAAADDTVGGAASLALPSAGAVPDYQLGGAYPPADGVGIVGRDRGAEPADDVYSICYVNAFQTQPGELDSWPEDLLLHADGTPVFDPDWPDEALADTSTDDKRGRIAAIVTPWITGCAADGFDAVEFDNLDSYTRSGGALV